MSLSTVALTTIVSAIVRHISIDTDELLQQQFLGAFVSGIFRTRGAQLQQQAGQKVRIYASTYSCYSDVTPNLRPGRYTRLPWNDVFRTVMARMEPAAKQGCVLHPSVCPFRYRFRIRGLPASPAKTHLHCARSSEGARFSGPFYVRRRYPRKISSDWECSPNSAGGCNRADVRNFADASQPGVWRSRREQPLMY